MDSKRKLFKVKYSNYFETKRYIITYTELKYYKDLLDIAKSLDLILLTKVSIYDLIKVKDTLYKKIAYKQCGHETIDFILADKATCRMRVCIQLEDPYNKQVREKTDNFINELFEELNIKLIRIQTNKEFNKEYLESQIRNIIKEPLY